MRVAVPTYHYMEARVRRRRERKLGEICSESLRANAGSNNDWVVLYHSRYIALTAQRKASAGVVEATKRRAGSKASV